MKLHLVVSICCALLIVQSQSQIIARPARPNFFTRLFKPVRNLFSRPNNNAAADVQVSSPSAVIAKPVQAIASFVPAVEEVIDTIQQEAADLVSNIIDSGNSQEFFRPSSNSEVNQQEDSKPVMDTESDSIISEADQQEDSKPVMDIQADPIISAHPSVLELLPSVSDVIESDSEMTPTIDQLMSNAKLQERWKIITRTICSTASYIPSTAYEPRYNFHINFKMNRAV